MLVYNKASGELIGHLPDSQTPSRFFRKRGEIFLQSIDSLNVDKPDDELKFYRVVNGALEKKSEIEIKEIIKYKKILTEEQRVNILLRPNAKEIQKAESMLEILTLLEEVSLI